MKHIPSGKNKYSQSAGRHCAHAKDAYYRPEANPQNSPAYGHSYQKRNGFDSPYSPAEASAFSPVVPSFQYGHTSTPVAQDNKSKITKGTKILLVVLAIMLTILIGGGIAVAHYFSTINENLSGGKTEAEQMEIKEQLTPATSFDEPFYMMLIGSDARADGSVEGERSDTNILCRIDPINNQVTMLSIPRDTMIQIEGYGRNKFNAAYTFGGPAGVIREASQLCGVEISHYAEVNFESLIELVDVVGGVMVDVPELIDDPDAGEFIIQPGEQLLDGAHALEFARCRSYVDGDFTRTSNQRLLIEALVDKVLSLSPAELPKVVKELSKSVETDMSIVDIISLATKFKNEGDLVIYSAMLPSTTAMIGGISYVVSDDYALKEMMKIVEAGGDPNTMVATGSAIGSYLSDSPYGVDPYAASSATTQSNASQGVDTL